MYSEVSVGKELGQVDWVEMPGDSCSIAGAGYCARARMAAQY